MGVAFGLVSKGWPRIRRCLAQEHRALTINDHLWAFFHDIFDWEDDALLEKIETWLSDWRSCTSTPRLEKLSLNLHAMDDQWGPTERYELEDLCSRTGISYEIYKSKKDFANLRPFGGPHDS
jgi:hypothetical protein